MVDFIKKNAFIWAIFFFWLTVWTYWYSKIWVTNNTVQIVVVFPEGTLCLSEDCIRTSGNYKSAMDTSVDPCEDFFQYACGSWVAEHRNLEVFDDMQNKVDMRVENILKSADSDGDPSPVRMSRELYRSCISGYKYSSPTRDLFTKYLKYLDLPYLPPQLADNYENMPTFGDWITYEINLKKTIHKNAFLSIYMDDDSIMRVDLNDDRLFGGTYFDILNKLKNSSQYDDYHHSGDYTYDDDDYNNKEVDYDNTYDGKYNTFIKDIIDYMSLFYKEYNKDIIIEAAELIDEMNQVVRSIATTNNGYYDPEALDIPLKNLDGNTEDVLYKYNISASNMNTWKLLISHLRSFTTINPAKLVIRLNLMKLDKLFTYLNSVDPKNVQLYLWYTAVTTIQENYGVMQSKYDDYPNSPEECSSLVQEFMSLAVAYSLANLYLDQTNKIHANAMVQNIIEAYEKGLELNKWLQKDTKKYIIQELHKMDVVLGYPNWLRNKSLIEDHYQNIELSEENFIGNLMQLHYIVYGGDTMKEQQENAYGPLVVNAFYDRKTNTINIPMAMFGYPIYHLGLESLNYGSIGAIIGHELIHSFSYKSERDVSTNSIIRCIIDQYEEENDDNYAQNKEEENLSDTVGLQLAYEAYHRFVDESGPEIKLPGFEKFSADQLFFLSYGYHQCSTYFKEDSDVHSVNRYRVISALQNSKEFSNSFSCPLGSVMNPSQYKCRLF